MNLKIRMLTRFVHPETIFRFFSNFSLQSKFSEKNIDY